MLDGFIFFDGWKSSDKIQEAIVILVVIDCGNLTGEHGFTLKEW